MPESHVFRTFTSRDGLALFARDYPGSAGPARCPVICLHGLTRNSLDFEDLAPWIASQGRRVIAMDIRGRGESARDPNPDNYNPKVYARDVLDFMAALGIARAVFIGTSMGGIITMVIAGKRLKAIAGAVLNDVGPKIAEAGLQRIAGYVGKSTPIGSWEEAAARIGEINGFAFPDNPPEEWMRWAERTFRQHADGTIALNYDLQIARALHAGKIPSASLIAKLLFRRLARNRPTLLLRGQISDLLGPAEAAYMRKVAPEMDYAEVPRVGHAPMMTEPQAQSALAAFLARVP